MKHIHTYKEQLKFSFYHKNITLYVPKFYASIFRNVYHVTGKRKQRNSQQKTMKPYSTDIYKKRENTL